jgi:hypothetical protein
MNPFAGSDSKKGLAKPALEEKATQPQGRAGLVLLLQDLKVGFAHFQIQINSSKSRILLFDGH